ncbi:MAG TPA: hypothetical protein VNY52_01660 [Solirubrobacteraceae bacterium]|jgi:hypothetical protein|nr:hypothetical protein [Solirubrobacteraceae bacterium]
MEQLPPRSLLAQVVGEHRSDVDCLALGRSLFVEERLDAVDMRLKPLFHYLEQELALAREIE